MVRLTVLTSKNVKIPKELVYERIKGRPVYYKGYEEVLKGEKSLEEVVGSSDLQSWIIMSIIEFLLINLDKTKYKILSNELGFKAKDKSVYGLDIGIFEREKIKELKGKYIETPPEVVIEVDIKADLKGFEDNTDYIYQKINGLLSSGIGKVIWIFTKSKKVWIATKDKKWEISGWNEDIEILDNVNINIEKLLKEEKIKF